MSIPSAHQSTALLCPLDWIISGARYSGVPQSVHVLSIEKRYLTHLFNYLQHAWHVLISLLFPIPTAVRDVRKFPIPTAVKGVREFPIPTAVRGVQEFPIPTAVRGVRRLATEFLLQRLPEHLITRISPRPPIPHREADSPLTTPSFYLRITNWWGFNEWQVFPELGIGIEPGASAFSDTDRWVIQGDMAG